MLGLLNFVQVFPLNNDKALTAPLLSFPVQYALSYGLIKSGIPASFLVVYRFSSVLSDKVFIGFV